MKFRCADAICAYSQPFERGERGDSQSESKSESESESESERRSEWVRASRESMSVRERESRECEASEGEQGAVGRAENGLEVQVR